jgi:hypothetical protein
MAKTYIPVRRDREPNNVGLTVSLPISTVLKLQQYSTKAGVTQSSAVRDFIQAGLEKAEQ